MKYRDIEGAFPRKKHFNYKNYAYDDYSDVTKKKATLFLSEFNRMSEMDMFKRLLKNKVIWFVILDEGQRVLGEDPCDA